MRRFWMLEIDLTSGEFKKVDVTELFSEWLGGTGVATKLLYDNCYPGLDPYSPQAPVIFAIGPLNNLFPVITKTVALFKSPLNGDLGESHAGGRLSLAMYESGYHAILIRGRAPSLSYVVIENDTVYIKPCNSLKEMSALATERVLRDSEEGLGKRAIVRIGPSGERLSPIACATVDTSRHFGRLGLGGVLGSKNLKAIVISGSKYWTLEKKREYNSLYLRLYKEVVQSDSMAKYHDLGTSMNVYPLSRINGLPTRNFSQGFFEGADKISGEEFARSRLSQQIACAGCPTGCIHMATLREPFNEPHHMYKTIKVSYDYELIYALGSNLSIDSTDMILKLLLYVEKQGWDAISIGVTLAWATEAFQRGLITERETDGVVLNFGDGEAYLKVLSRIAAGKNQFFKDLERGADYCSKKYGGKDLSITFNSNEAPGYVTGPFAFIGYATGVRHSHLDNAGYSLDQKAATRLVDFERTILEMYEEGVWRMILNSLVACLFSRKIYDINTIVESLSAVGIDWSADRLTALSHRIHGLKYLFKERNGFTLDKLTLPEKLSRVYMTNGKVDEERFRKGLELYGKLVEKDTQLPILDPD